jgi:hypothetical protein
MKIIALRDVKRDGTNWFELNANLRCLPPVLIGNTSSIENNSISFFSEFFFIYSLSLSKIGENDTAKTMKTSNGFASMLHAFANEVDQSSMRIRSWMLVTPSS